MKTNETFSTSNSVSQVCKTLTIVGKGRFKIKTVFISGIINHSCGVIIKTLFLLLNELNLREAL